MGLTAEERALIDAAVDAGQVTRIAPGVSSAPEVIWCPKDRQLRYVDKAAAQRVLRGPAWRSPVRRGPRESSPEIVARRTLVAAEVKAGRSRSQIYAALGITPGVLDSDLAALGLKMADHYIAPPRSPSSEVLARRERVRAAFDGEKSVTRLAEEVGLSPKVVREHLVALGLKAPDGRKSRGPTRKVAARRKLVAEMRAGGRTIAEIADLFNVAVQTISSDCAAIKRGCGG